jgi:hypothetical protein
MTTEVPDEMRREIVAGCKRALLLTRNYLGRDLRDDEIEIVVMAIMRHFGFGEPRVVH